MTTSSLFLKNTCTETTLGLENGLRIAVKQWGDELAPMRVLALHGYLDNANTWDKLAPYLISNHKVSIRLVCMDFSGHGKSSHISKDANVSLASRVLEVLDVADALHWDKFSLLCHSMGAAVGLLVAGTVPERITRLIMVDGIGPWPARYDAAQALRRAVQDRRRLFHRQRRVYPSIEPAIQRYLESNKGMGYESAKLILQRSMEEVEVFEIQSVANDNNDIIKKTVRETGLCFRHDPRLTGSNIYYYDENAILTFCSNIKAPVLVFFATNAERRKESAFFQQILLPLFEERCKSIDSITVKLVESSHHLHLDSVEEVYESVIDFLENPKNLPEFNNKFLSRLMNKSSKL